MANLRAGAGGRYNVGILTEGGAMNAIQLDAATAELLKKAEAGAVLLGPDGTPVGGFVPEPVRRDLPWMLERRKRLYDEALSEVSLEELKAADAAGGEIPHEEVMKLLGLE
jgi:hypothetical protein